MSYPRFLSLLVLFCTLSAWATEPVLMHRVEVFNSANTWESISTFLEPVGDGRLKVKKQESSISVGRCEDLLTQFQNRPLDVMEQNAYISPTMKADLLNLKKLGIKPSQILMVTQYSDLTEEEARSIFPDPQELRVRTLKSRTTEGKVRVSRGTVWAIRGFEYDPDKPELEFSPLPLPWDRGSLPHLLSRRFDRKKVPFVYEIGRALAEDKPLPGQFRTLTALLTRVIITEVGALGLKPEQVIITGHALQHRQGQLFSTLFPMRPLTQAALEKIEATGSTEGYLDQAPPTGEQWKALDDTVSYGSLDQFDRKFPAGKISENAARLEAASNGDIPAREGPGFWRDFQTLFRQDFDFEVNGVGRAKNPLIVVKMGEALFIKDLLNLFARFGLRMKDIGDEATGMRINRVMELWQKSISVNFSPDLFLDNWNTNTLFMHPAFSAAPGQGPLHHRIAHLIMNLDEKLHSQFPRLYLPLVILGLYQQVDQELRSLNEYERTITLGKINEDRQVFGKPAVNRLSSETYFDTYALALGPSNAAMARELEQLGAKTIRGSAMKLQGMGRGGPQSTGTINIGLSGVEVNLYTFEIAQIKKLQSEFPYLESPSRDVLKTRQHPTRIRLFFSATL